MLDFFIAVFGGAYYGYKIIKEKGKSNSIEARNKAAITQSLIDVKKWEKDMLDQELQDSIDDLFKSRDIKHIYKLAHPTLCQFDFYNIDNEQDFEKLFLSEYYNKLMIKRILMAKRGKLLKEDVYGIRTPIVIIKNVREPKYIKEWHKFHEFMIWMDKELQSHGVEPMLFKKGLWMSFDFDGARIKASILQDLKDQHPVLCRYYWESGNFYNQW